jgi:hypothetical protein
VELISLCIRGPDESQVEKAKELANDLLDVVRQEYEKARQASMGGGMGMSGYSGYQGQGGQGYGMQGMQAGAQGAYAGYYVSSAPLQLLQPLLIVWCRPRDTVVLRRHPQDLMRRVSNHLCQVRLRMGLLPQLELLLQLALQLIQMIPQRNMRHIELTGEYLTTNPPAVMLIDIGFATQGCVWIRRERSCIPSVAGDSTGGRHWRRRFFSSAATGCTGCIDGRRP